MPAIDHQKSEEQEIQLAEPANDNIDIENRPHSAQQNMPDPPQHDYVPPPRQLRSQRQLRRAKGMPRWAYDQQERHIAIQERLEAAIQILVEIVKDIRGQ